MISTHNSPIDELVRLSHTLGIDLRVKRDDLYPFTGGGNKARKITRILQDCKKTNCNWLITCGGLQSNHARVVALTAARNGWGCTLVLHGDPSSTEHPSGNLMLCKVAGANIVVVDPDAIGVTLRGVKGNLENNGRIPYEIPGGGHCNAGAQAYVDAAYELQHQCSEDGWIPDWIIHASGTGTTQAGIAVGVDFLNWPTRVVGISVARRNPRGTDVIRQSCADLLEYLGKDPAKDMGIDFRDSWICGGYESYDESVIATIKLTAETEGLILDPTYTGKAFTGLCAMVRSGEILQGAKVLFWHTGGLLNLLSQKDINLARSLS